VFPSPFVNTHFKFIMNNLNRGTTVGSISAEDMMTANLK